jgi:hypothetical protein
MFSKLTPAVVAIGLLAARSAHADAIGDFKTGTTVAVQMATVDIGDGPRSTGGAAVYKPSGTLDFALSAADLGMNAPVTIHLRGYAGRNGLIAFVVDDTYASIILGPGYTLTRITGLVQMEATRVPGTAMPRVGNVRLRVLPGSYLNTYGTWGMQTLAITSTSFIGGVTQPALDAFVHTGDHLLCSDTVATTQTFALWLTDVAQRGGAAVDLVAPLGGRFDLPTTAIVPTGRRSMTVTAKIAPNFVGSVRLTAAAGGEQRSLDLVVRPRSDCDAGPNTRPSLQSWISAAIAGCASCTDYVDINHDNEKLATINGRLVVIRGTQKIDVREAFPTATAVTAGAINNDGTLTGRITIGGITQAYRANMNHGAPTPLLLGAMTPEAINNYDVVVGSRPQNGVQQAVFSNGRGIVPLALQSGYGIVASRALDIADSGQIVGTYTDAAGLVRGFRWFRNVTRTLPVVGVKPAIPVAVNRAGQIAVNGANSLGQPVAAIVSPTGAVTSLGVPTGFAMFEVKSINRFGAVAGIAKTSGLTVVQRAFVWRPGRGFAPLTGYVTNLTATDALRITDANQVVVRGTYNGVADLYLITL